ncbi:MAG: adenylate kinase [Oscillospiraceae bacterium]
MKLIFLGAPGAGKSTQAESISKVLSVPAISTGSIIRDAIKSGTEAGLVAKKYVEEGNLVPDELVIQMLQDRIALPDCNNGYILDGFPRNLAQAQALDHIGVIIDMVIDIEVPDDVILERLSGRRMCGKCGDGYHITHKPSAKGDNCELCGGQLTAREDDDPRVIGNRLKVYHQQIESLKDYYHAAGKLAVVAGDGEIDQITKMVMAVIEA